MPATSRQAGIIGALMFIVTLGVGPLARNLRESEERVRQREVDVANLAELNQFIVQHLRESILVVDANDTIRLINESAALLLHGASVPQGTPLGEVSPRLLYLLDTWRRRSDDWQLSTLTMLASDGGSLVQPHFVSLDSSGKGPVAGVPRRHDADRRTRAAIQARGARPAQRQHRA
jgi:two-component system sensor histidine kinase PilS (NtrC family)